MIEFHLKSRKFLPKRNFRQRRSEQRIFVYHFKFHKRKFTSIICKICFSKIVMGRIIFGILCNNLFGKFCRRLIFSLFNKLPYSVNALRHSEIFNQYYGNRNYKNNRSDYKDKLNHKVKLPLLESKQFARSIQ